MMRTVKVCLLLTFSTCTFCPTRKVLEKSCSLSKLSLATVCWSWVSTRTRRLYLAKATWEVLNWEAVLLRFKAGGY